MGQHGLVIERDVLIRWAASAREARVWRRPEAVIVACPNLSHWNRLVMSGDPDALAVLMREVLLEVDASFRPFGDEDLVTAVVERVPELEVSARFAWMETTEPVGPRVPEGAREAEDAAKAAGKEEEPGEGVREAEEPTEGAGKAEATAEGAGQAAWLPGTAWPEVSALIEESFPDSYAKPGDPDVRRWAGIRGDGGRLLAVAAEAWSTDEIGFMAGVTTRPDARGLGLGARLCAFVTDEQLVGRERVALLADYWNTAAIATYRKLGFTLRPVAAARQR